MIGCSGRAVSALGEVREVSTTRPYGTGNECGGAGGRCSCDAQRLRHDGARDLLLHLADGAASSTPEAFADVVDAIGGGGPTAAAVRFPLLHPATASVLVRLSSRAHGDELLDAVEDLEPDPTRFRSVIHELAENEPPLDAG